MVFAVTKCTEELYQEIVKREYNIFPSVHHAMNNTILPLHFTIELISGMPHIRCSYANEFQYAKVLDKETFLQYYCDFTFEINNVLNHNANKAYVIKQLIAEIKNL